MDERTEYRDDAGTLLAYKIGTDVPKGLCAFSEDDDYAQVLSWHYPADKRLLAHEHLSAPRAAEYTQEVVVVLDGSLQADIYDSREVRVAQVEVHAGEAIVLLRGGHGYRILADDTRVLEIKNGPYAGAEADRRRLAG